MSASTSILADLTTAQTSGPGTVTKAAVLAAAGPIGDYVGNLGLAQLKLKEAASLLTTLKQATDSGDTANLALINGVLAVINGTSTPATTAVTDLGTLITNGPSAPTAAKAIAAAGPIIDYKGCLQLVQLKLKEAWLQLHQLAGVTDQSGDAANYALINNSALALT